MAILTVGLQNLRRQVNAVFPDRDTKSDGWIGDTAHQASTSGHNPDDTAGSKAAWNGDSDSLQEVRAWDMDSDLGDGVDAQVLVDHVRRLPGVADVLRYLIYDRKIYHSRVGFSPAPYSGPSPHEEHVHFEGAFTQAADSNASFNFRLEEIPVALTEGDKAWIMATVRSEAAAAARAAVDARVGDVVPRWTSEGDRVSASDPNPTMAASEGIAYLGATARRAENNTAKILAEIAKLATKLPASK